MTYFEEFMASRRLTSNQTYSSDDFIQYLQRKGFNGTVNRVYFRPTDQVSQHSESRAIIIDGKNYELVREEELSIEQACASTQSYYPYDPSEVRYTWISASTHTWSVDGASGLLDTMLGKAITVYLGKTHPIAKFILALWGYFDLPENRYGFVSSATENTKWEPYYMYEVYGGIYGWQCKVTTNMRKTNALYIQVVTDELTGEDKVGTLHYQGVKWEYSYGWESHNEMLQEAWDRYHGGLPSMFYPYYTGLAVDNSYMLP